jgi:hypothetical protein
VPIDPPVVGPTLTSRTGFNTYAAANQESAENSSEGPHGYEQFSDAVSLVKEYGGTFVRSPANWIDWNETVGDTGWAADASKYFGFRERAARSAGVATSVVCTTFRGNLPWPTSSEGIESYSNNTVEIVKAYRNKVGSLPVIEIGNEVTNDPQWMSDEGRQSYVNIVKLVKKKLVDAGLGDTQIWSSSVSNNTGAKVSQLDFLAFCRSQGLDDIFHGYVVNLYKGHAPGTFPEDNITDLKAFLAATSKPVRVGEFGYHTDRWTSEQQVDLNLRAMLSILIASESRPVLACLYEIRDRGDGSQGFCSGARNENSCVPVEKYPNADPSEAVFGLVTQSKEPKAGAAKWKRFFAELGGFEYESGGPTQEEPTRYRVKLKKGNQTATVEWTKGAASNPTSSPTWSIVGSEG